MLAMGEIDVWPLDVKNRLYKFEWGANFEKHL